MPVFVFYPPKTTTQLTYLFIYSTCQRVVFIFILFLYSGPLAPDINMHERNKTSLLI